MKKVKSRDSDEEDVQEEQTQTEALCTIQTIPESEISPAAFIFEQRDDADELSIYEEKYGLYDSLGL